MRPEPRLFIRYLAGFTFAVSLSGCTDENAQQRLDKAIVEIERLQTRLQANEELLNRIYKSTLGGAGNGQTAADLAQEALDAAKGAQSCCDANTERLDRMYQKIMRLR